MIKKQTFRWIRESLPVIVSLVLFVALVVASLSFTSFKKDQWEKDAKGRLLEILVAKKTKLEKALYSRIHYTRSVAAYVSLRPDITGDEFNNLAGELIRSDSVISTMALSKDCVIGAVYPLKGHEAAIGLDLLGHPERREIVEKTIETHESYVAGPVELIEGGIAFISYTPIFDKTRSGDQPFWGVTDIVIRQDRLLNEALLFASEEENRFALRGYNGLGHEGAIFWGDTAVFDRNPVTVDIELPYGKWILAAVPERGWSAYLDQDRFLMYILLASSLIISILLGMFSRAVIRIRNSEQELRRMNATKDKLFSIIAHDLKSPFNSLLGFTDILDEQLDTLSENKVREILKTLRKTTYETHNLLTNLLNWSQSQQGKIQLRPSVQNLHALTEQVMAGLAGPALKKEISVYNDTDRSHNGYFDSETMALVLRNLLSNALKYTHRKGEVRISSALESDRVVLTVTDNGVGISAEDREKMFRVDTQITTRGTENEKGTGIGLILCKEFTELNGGTLKVESQFGKGSQFSIRIKPF